MRTKYKSTEIASQVDDDAAITFFYGKLCVGIVNFQVHEITTVLCK